MHATTEMNAEDIILNIITQKEKYSMIPLYHISRVVKFIETKRNDFQGLVGRGLGSVMSTVSVWGN